MEENTIFHTGQNPLPPKQLEAVQLTPLEVQPSPPAQSTQPQPSQEPPPPPPPSDGFFSSLPFGSILKAGIGILIVVFIVVFVFFVVSKLGQSKNEKVTLTYWGLWEDSGVMQGVIGDFQKQYPNITVSYTKEDIKQYRERLTTRIKNGTGPDIFRYHNTWVPELSSLLLPLPNEVIKGEEFKKQYYPVASSDLIKNGALYGIPLQIDTLSLFINTEIFKQAGENPPKTWEEFLRIARVLTVKDENGKIKTSGAATGTYDNISHAPDIISLLMVQNGVNLQNPSQTAASASDALNFYTLFAQGDGKVWDATLDPSVLAFAKGNLAMFFGYSWDVFTIKAINPNLSFQIVEVPHLPGRNQTIASYWVEGISTKSKHQKEAFLFMKFLARPETEQKLFSEISKTRFFGEPYAHVSLAETLKSNQLVYPFVAQAQNANASSFVADTYDNGLNTRLNSYLSDAIRSILASTSTDTAIDTLSKGVQQVLQQYGI